MVWLASRPSGPIPCALELTRSPRQVRQAEACRDPAEGVVEAGRGGAKWRWAGTEPVKLQALGPCRQSPRWLPGCAAANGRAGRRSE